MSVSALSYLLLNLILDSGACINQFNIKLKMMCGDEQFMLQYNYVTTLNIHLENGHNTSTHISKSLYVLPPSKYNDVL
jgi:hypothetical protein